MEVVPDKNTDAQAAGGERLFPSLPEAILDIDGLQNLSVTASPHIANSVDLNQREWLAACGKLNEVQDIGVARLGWVHVCVNQHDGVGASHEQIEVGAVVRSRPLQPNG